jgi:hypothetical protein
MRMAFLILSALMIGCATQRIYPPLSGSWEFNSELTYQSIYDMDGGIDPRYEISFGTRVDYQFTNRIFDFDNMELVVIGNFENDKELTTYKYDLVLLKESVDFIWLQWADHSNEENKVKMAKTRGCYYIRESIGFNEYYCKNSL